LTVSVAGSGCSGAGSGACRCRPARRPTSRGLRSRRLPTGSRPGRWRLRRWRRRGARSQRGADGRVLHEITGKCEAVLADSDCTVLPVQPVSRR
jgi:hypothetical protein